MLTYRHAVDADRPALEWFSHAAIRERSYEDIIGPVDWATVALTDEAVAVVAVDDGRVVGCFVAALVTHPLSRRIYADQVLWYVAPAYRRYRIGPTLFRRIYGICLTKGIQHFRVVQPVDRPRWARFLRRVGFRPVETGWVLTCAEASHECDVQARHRPEHRRDGLHVLQR